jgi:hypothetical protein
VTINNATRIEDMEKYLMLLRENELIRRIKADKRKDRIKRKDKN